MKVLYESYDKAVIRLEVHTTRRSESLQLFVNG
jgi:hypothetical protein